MGVQLHSLPPGIGRLGEKAVTSWNISPLRYPGGKGELAPFLAGVLRALDPRPRTYVEPFAGGAGAALRLLLDECVLHVVLNDINPGIAAFWRCVFEQPDALIAQVEEAPLTIDYWREQRTRYQQPKGASDLELGFATFYLNRTNRSGILEGGVIGGVAQTGPWKMDARFNRNTLVTRIRTLSQYSNRVTVLEEDGVGVAARYVVEDAFIYADPPYLRKGIDLYLDTLTWQDHVRLANALTESHGRWMVSYDDDARIDELYAGSDIAMFNIGHRARTHRVGREAAVFSPALRSLPLHRLGRGAKLRARAGDA